MKHVKPISGIPEPAQSSLQLKAGFLVQFTELALTKTISDGSGGGGTVGGGGPAGGGGGGI